MTLEKLQANISDLIALAKQKRHTATEDTDNLDNEIARMVWLEEATRVFRQGQDPPLDQCLVEDVTQIRAECSRIGLEKERLKTSLKNTQAAKEILIKECEALYRAIKDAGFDVEVC